jgi:putative phosphoribosyl transferase
MVQHDTMRPCLVRDVRIDMDSVSLAGRLTIPQNAGGIVLFVHGSGSSRHSPRNQFVAEILQAKGTATLLFDLLTAGEEYLGQRTASLRFDIDLLTWRLVGVTAWTKRNPLTQGLRIGYFGASTGAAAALAAAARLQQSVAAVVSRGGRPDLAADALGLVRAPTLLIVGSRDETVLELNRLALAQLRSPEKELVIVPGATHLFEEPGALEEVARTAAEWFARHLANQKLESHESPSRRDRQHSGR